MTPYPTRVLHVAHNILPHVGGLEAVVAAETRGLAARGHDVTVIGASSSAPPGTTREDGVRVVRVRAWHGLERRFAVPFPLFSPLLAHHVNREVRRADLVHIHDVLYLTSWLAALVCRITGTPYVVHRHVGFVHHDSRLVRLVQRAVLGSAGRMVTGGAARLLAIDEHVAAELGSQRVPVEVLGNGVDTEVFRPGDDAARRRTRERHGLPLDRVLVLFVGRFVPKKGFDQVLAAARPDYDLVFVGGERPPAVTTPGTHFLGSLPAADLPAVYAASDVMVVASVGECPLTVLESMASGLPLVAHDDPALHSPWTAGSGVRFVDVRSGGLATLLTGLAADPGARDRLGSDNRTFVADRFSWRTHLDQLLDTYGRAVTRR